MRRTILSLGLFLGLCATAAAQQNIPCIGVGGINAVPAIGIVCVQDSTVPSYAAAVVSLAPATTATDIACLTGSATKTIRLKRVVLSGTATTIINVPMFVAKRAVADSGGTSPTTIATGLPIAFALDSTFVAPTATVVSYTANPTINDTNWSTTVANIVASTTVPFATVDTVVGQIATTIDFAEWTGISPPVLRGVAQQICISMNTSGATVATPAGGLVSVTWNWTEQ